MQINGAIFDLDGTILDSMPVWTNIAGRYLAAHGIEPQENLDDKFNSLSPAEAAAWLREAYGLEEDVGVVIRGLNEIVRAPYYETVQPKPGAPAFLRELRAQGARMCIATATDRHLVEAALRRLDLLDCFDGIFTCSEAGAGKTQPVIFQKALAFLRTQPRRTVVFEDAVHAIRTAKSIGLPVAAVYDEKERAHQGEIRALADWYAPDLGSLRGVFSGRGPSVSAESISLS